MHFFPPFELRNKTVEMHATDPRRRFQSIVLDQTKCVH